MFASWKIFKKWNHWAIETNLLDICLIRITIFYLVLPILLFAFGWMKPLYAGLFSVLVLFGSIQALRCFEYRKITINNQKIIFIVIVIAMLTTWLLLSGIGGYGLQSGDFHARNAIFRDLINHNWPVRYDYSDQPFMQNFYGPSGVMVYYLIFWLPAALFGKLFGWQNGNLMLFVWSLLGLLLAVYLLSRKIGRANLWIVIAFIFFSGMDIIFARNSTDRFLSFNSSQFPEFLKNIWAALLSTDAIEWWANFYFQYSSLTTQLYNVFNQAIPAWIVTLLVLNETQNKNHIFWYSLLVLFAPLPFIGLFPYILQKSLSPGTNIKIWHEHSSYFGHGKWAHFFSLFKQNLSFQNGIVAGMIVVISGIFFFSNAGSGARDYGFIWDFLPQKGNLFVLYIMFCFVEFLLLGLLLYKDSHEKGMLILTLFFLLLIPLIKYGSWNEFSMRVSIPPLMVLFVLMLKNFFTNGSHIHSFTRFLRNSMIVFVLIIGSITSIHEIHRSIDAIISAHGSPPTQDALVSFDYGENTDKTVGATNFVVSDRGNLPFFQIFSK